MKRISRSMRLALACCLPFLLCAVAGAQQPAAAPAYTQPQQRPQAYPQTPYPQTGAPTYQAPQTGGAPPSTGVQPSMTVPRAPQPPIAQPAAAVAGPAAGPPAAPFVPEGFQLNQVEQAELDAVLSVWQTQSSKIDSFKCEFDRHEYDMAFSPTVNGALAPLNKNQGELSYSKPDKGSFQITKISTFKTESPPAGQQPPAQIKGDWIEQKDAIGEHWVSDGKSIYEYQPQNKQLVERPIPPQMQGQAIVDGPLPFLFGAEAAKLKQRYWMKIEHPPTATQQQIWLAAKPKFQEQAANFRDVEVIFNRQQMLPEAMQVTLPNGDRHVYLFKLATAKANGPLKWLDDLFSQPHVPWGWKRVVENMPLAQTPVQPEQKTR